MLNRGQSLGPNCAVNPQRVRSFFVAWSAQMLAGMRVAFLGWALAAASYFVQTSSAGFVALVVAFLLGGAIYEIAIAQLTKKIARWPSDVENAERVLALVGSNDAKEALLDIQFGHIGTRHLDRIIELAEPDLVHQIFHDHALAACARTIRERASKLLSVVRREMFSRDDGGDGLVIPLEWKRAGHGSAAQKRYYKTQEDIGRLARELVEAIDSFTHCLAGASSRR
jgi:hypothetical protein